MKMAERDLKWTTKVNRLFNGGVYMDLIENLKPGLDHEVKTQLMVEIWMLSASYPYLRAYVMRKVKNLLSEHPEQTEYVIEKFHAVDDPYILWGLYAAVYGTMVSEDDADYSRLVSE